jgi:hypothetical protein
MVFAFAEIVFAFAEIVFAVAEMIFAVAEMVFAVAEMVFAVAEMIFAVAEMIFAVAEMVFAVAEMIFEVYLSSKKVRSLLRHSRPSRSASSKVGSSAALPTIFSHHFFCTWTGEDADNCNITLICAISCSRVMRRCSISWDVIVLYQKIYA